MRTYGRDINGAWQALETSATGDNSEIMLATFAQNLKLLLGESPFFGTNGIPVNATMQTQVPPDYYVALMQQKFAQYFVSLTTQRAIDSNGNPVYNISAILPSGAVIQAQVPT